MTPPNLHFVLLTRPYSFTSPVSGREFAAWIVANDTTLTNDECNLLSDQLIAAKCRYAVCSGHECSGFHDAIDFAYMKTDPNYDPPDETHVMTTWHDDEDVQTIAHEFVWCTCFDEWAAEEFVIVAVGDGPDAQRAVDAARKLLVKRYS